MNRRESLRSIVLGSMAGTLALESCTGAPEQEVVDKIWKHQYGRTPKEQAIDEKLLAEQYFGSHEMQTITVLAQLILPRPIREPSNKPRYPLLSNLWPKIFLPFKPNYAEG